MQRVPKHLAPHGVNRIAVELKDQAVGNGGNQVHVDFLRAMGRDVQVVSLGQGRHLHELGDAAQDEGVGVQDGGATLLDASLAGLGRGAGNCPMELLVAFLQSPRYQLRPLLHCIQHYIEPMRHQLRWGYDVPYMMTGVLNQHPRAGIEFNASADRGDYVKFFDSMRQKE